MNKRALFAFLFIAPQCVGMQHSVPVVNNPGNESSQRKRTAVKVLGGILAGYLIYRGVKSAHTPPHDKAVFDRMSIVIFADNLKDKRASETIQDYYIRFFNTPVRELLNRGANL